MRAPVLQLDPLGDVIEVVEKVGGCHISQCEGGGLERQRLALALALAAAIDTHHLLKQATYRQAGQEGEGGGRQGRHHVTHVWPRGKTDLTPLPFLLPLYPL